MGQSYEKKVVCFACLNAYHLFISYILSNIRYENDDKILILSGHYSILKRAYNEILLESKIWKQVILIEDNSIVKRRKQLNKINFDSIDIIHYFTYSSYNVLLFPFVKERTKIILTDEGVMTYIFKECLECRKIQGWDIEKVSQVLVLDKRLYISTLNKPVQNIELETCVRDKVKLRYICKKLNKIFGYKHKPINSNVVFFDQPLSKTRIINEQQEKKLLYTVLNNFMKYKVLVKKHPSDSYDKYGNIGVKIMNYQDIPWELVLLNEYINNKANLYGKVFISYNSAALINTRILYNIFKIPCTSIFMYKLIKPSIQKSVSDLAFQKFMYNFKSYYSEYMYDINSIEEIKDIIKL
ncbi:hypothetical protein [Inediibacterium massiliense]|uniref:hypothetical protein n=1 Tax=Inediibacterium massiliense TaxID=1658111 RepID=UPI0006B56332|nr:hypothetical protein [Inediibacterium massiliense]